MGTKVDTLETRFEKIIDEVEALKQITFQLIQLCGKKGEISVYVQNEIDISKQMKQTDVEKGKVYRLQTLLSQLNK